MRAGFSAVAAALSIALVCGGVAHGDEVPDRFTSGQPVAVPPLSTSVGVATTDWSDPYCRPQRGTRPPEGSPAVTWQKLLANELIGETASDAVQKSTSDAVKLGWQQYLEANKGQTPPGIDSLATAQDIAKSRITSALLDPNFYLQALARITNVTKPAGVNSREFIGHIDLYALSGVTSVGCDGADGYRLYTSTPDGDSDLAYEQLGPDGTWARLAFDNGAQLPPANGEFFPVPGATRTYLVTVPAGNPLDHFGMPLERVAGELTISPDAQISSCLADSSTNRPVDHVMAAMLYSNVRSALQFMPDTPLDALPEVSDECASVSAVYTPQSNGPLLGDGSFAISDGAKYLAGYTVDSSHAYIARFGRTGSTWDAGEEFAGPTGTNWGDDEVPHLDISPNGQTVASCFTGTARGRFGPISYRETPRWPMIFHFGERPYLAWPHDAAGYPKDCADVSLTNASVFYQTFGSTPQGWWQASTELEPDATPPSISCDAPPADWQPTDISLACRATDLDSGLADTSQATFTVSTDVPQGAQTAQAALARPEVCDRAGNCARPVAVTARVDRQAPVLTCPAVDPAWRSTDARMHCDAHDDGSGLAGPTGADLATHVSDGQSDAAATTDSLTICDQVANCVTAGPLGPFRIDKAPPTIAITTPSEGASYRPATAVGGVSIVPAKLADFSCQDPAGGSGLASCTSTIPEGQPVNDGSPGKRTMTVTATDQAGNTTTRAVNYTVSAVGCVSNHCA